MEKANRIIKHDCGNGISIILEHYTWMDDSGNLHDEFLTFIEKDGIAWQDLTMVALNTDTKNPSVNIKVWGDSGCEDYTNEFDVDIYEE